MPGEPLAPSLRLGVPLIDKEHQALLDAFHRLIDGSPADLGSERFSEVMSRLGTLLAGHFENEESLIRTCGMSADEVDAHLAAHTEILEQYAHIQFDLMGGRAMDRTATFHMIESWFVEHIATHDIKLKQRLSGR